MSRSYRKPYVKDGPNPKHKRFANRAVRLAKDVPSGKAYRKFYQPYDICDFRWLASEAWREKFSRK